MVNSFTIDHSPFTIYKSHLYKIKEIYYTLQGEGAHAGRPAVFCRFTGCNLWSGREEDRTKAICQFCDTDFWGTDGENGGKYQLGQLVQKIMDLWPNSKLGQPYVVCTGGEPLLQLDEKLVTAFHKVGFEVAIETNGTQEAPKGIDWICVSPKAGTELVLQKGNELKLVYPQKDALPKLFEHLDFEYFYLQPMDGPNIEENTKRTIEYCLNNPKWKMTYQCHKIWGVR